MNMIKVINQFSTRSSCSISSSQSALFLERWIDAIHAVHKYLSVFYEHHDYLLLEGDIHEIQDLLSRKMYKMEPMRVIDIKKEDKEDNDFCYSEGLYYPFPHENSFPRLNDGNFIFRRFPIDFLINFLSLSYYDRFYLSFDMNESMKGDKYIKSTLSDYVVLSALIIALIQSLEEQPSYFPISSYNNYQSQDSFQNFIDAIGKWKGVVAVFYIDLNHSQIQRSQVLSQLLPLLNEDPYVIEIITSILNLPIIDEAGKDLSSETGLPMIPILDDILFNIYLKQLDQRIALSLPKLKYARYQRWMLIPITKKSIKDIISILHTMNEICCEYNIISSIKSICLEGYPFNLYNMDLIIKGGQVQSYPSEES
ncbi:unnamed protein product [Cochlearia groenlandica]